MMLKQTKIVASISDLRCEVDFIRSLFDAGMNVVRMNTAHGTREGMDKLIHNVREVSNRIAILIDTKGPEVRTTKLANMEDSEQLVFHVGEKVRIIGNPDVESTHEQIAVSYKNFVKDLKVGADILIDDGELELRVIEKTDEYLVCEVQNEASMGHRKSVNVPGVRINLPSLTEKDRTNIKYAIERDIDFIAHSFVRTKQDILDIREILDEYGSDIKIIAKIENQEGVDNIDEILEVADGVMVARGDLGIEVPQERIPGIQRILIKKCVLAKKPVIVATQMLHTMIKNPRPTRAEVTDIANAIYYRTDAVMLSGETAYGKYPVEAVQTMAKVAKQAEIDKLPDNDIKIPLAENTDVTAFLAKQAVKATNVMPIKAIITDSFSGTTARNLAAFRGKYPVLAICYKEKTMRHLALSYGVEAIYMPEKANGQAYYFAALRKLIDDGVLKDTDMVAYLSSGKQGTKTSFLEINVVGDVLKAEMDYVLPNRKRYL
ncbi:MAG: pyruvate kinase [Bacteroidaceae bacterium]|nr:pyruvate kinase [Bacteroidaceae bacterium]